jgi:hypothetical protein
LRDAEIPRGYAPRDDRGDLYPWLIKFRNSPFVFVFSSFSVKKLHRFDRRQRVSGTMSVISGWFVETKFASKRNGYQPTANPAGISAAARTTATQSRSEARRDRATPIAPQANSPRSTECRLPP